MAPCCRRCSVAATAPHRRTPLGSAGNLPIRRHVVCVPCVAARPSTAFCLRADAARSRVLRRRWRRRWWWWQSPLLQLLYAAVWCCIHAAAVRWLATSIFLNHSVQPTDLTMQPSFTAHTCRVYWGDGWRLRDQLLAPVVVCTAMRRGVWTQSVWMSVVCQLLLLLPLLMLQSRHSTLDARKDCCVVGQQYTVWLLHCSYRNYANTRLCFWPSRAFECQKIILGYLCDSARSVSQPRLRHAQLTRCFYAVAELLVIMMKT